jgi:hypothetical protein
LCLEMFDWAKFRRTKGAIKLHLLLDHDGYLPCFAIITEEDRGYQSGSSVRLIRHDCSR